jgi:tetratricopeptide (TPR) repeat protein
MGDKVTFDTPLGVVVLLIPVAVILTLVVLLWRRRRKQSGTSSSPRDASSGTFHAIAQPLTDTEKPAAQVIQQVPQEVLQDAHQDDAPAKPEAILAVIENAIADGETTTLSGLYFKLAAAYGAEGDLRARMEALRSAAGNGALYGPHAAHAAARLALGEAAQAAGDLTSACEQWQLARTAFLEGGDTDQHARVEKQMRENGCPTDWVLTDF